MRHFSYFKLWAIKNKNYDESSVLAHHKKKKNKIGRHKILIIFLLNNLNKTDEAIARTLVNDLESIRKLRNRADYDFNKNITKYDAELVFKRSKKIIKYLTPI